MIHHRQCLIDMPGSSRGMDFLDRRIGSESALTAQRQSANGRNQQEWFGHGDASRLTRPHRYGRFAEPAIAGGRGRPQVQIVFSGVVASSPARLAWRVLVCGCSENADESAPYSNDLDGLGGRDVGYRLTS
jgi:hypothetical protein